MNHILNFDGQQKGKVSDKDQSICSHGNNFKENDINKSQRARQQQILSTLNRSSF